MELVLTRFLNGKNKDFTEGRLTVDGNCLCDTLEPKWRDIGWGRPGRKVQGRTAVPEGRYAVAVTLSPKFGRWLPLLLNVPLFRGIRIHEGNTADDTAGCILVGRKAGEGRLCDSRIMMHRLMKLLDSRPEGEAVWITIRSNPVR